MLNKYYDIFDEIEEDLFTNLMNIEGINNPDYQVIFTGHSLGGAIATISSFYFIKNYKFNSENILLTFGQPKVGNEPFAKYLTDNLKQIYRISRPKDMTVLFPFSQIDYFFKALRIAKGIKWILDLIVNIYSGNYLTLAVTIINFVKDRDDIISDYAFIFKEKKSNYFEYSHTGGLYMIDDDNNKVYHCVDFFNRKIEHPICKNHPFKLPDYVNNKYKNNYLSLNQGNDIRYNCRNSKFLLPFRLWNKNTLRRLEIINDKELKKITYNIIKKRKLNNFQISQENIELFTKYYFEENKNEFLYKLQSQEKIKNENLILVLNPQNNNIFGEICFFQNIAWIINNEIESINCNQINIIKPVSLKILLKKEIINEKELYIYIKGKISGYLELYDISKEYVLNITSSYFIPLIDSLPPESSLNFRLPKIKENIYINAKIYSFVNNTLF